jgi:hypothetical protein
LCDANEHLGRDRDRVDELVGEVVVERLSRSDVADLLVGDDRAVRLALERAAGLRARLDVAAAAFAADEITASQLKRISGELRPALAEAEQEVRIH